MLIFKISKIINCNTTLISFSVKTYSSKCCIDIVTYIIFFLWLRH